MKMGEVILFESFSLTPDCMLMICMVYLVGFFYASLILLWWLVVLLKQIYEKE